MYEYFMPIIQKGNNIIDKEIQKKIDIQQKLDFTKAKLKVFQRHDTIKVVKESVNISESPIKTTLYKIEQNENAQISKLAESMAKRTEAAIHKIEQNENAQISKLAESMTKTTESILRNIEQNESENISKMIKNMHKITDATFDRVQQISNKSGIDLKYAKLSEKSQHPWFQ
jgi:hypothetical protein